MHRSSTLACSVRMSFFSRCVVSGVFYCFHFLWVVHPHPYQADICQLGMDQRKVNMLAREYAETLKPKRFKPVILSHRMLPGLLEVCVCGHPTLVPKGLVGHTRSVSVTFALLGARENVQVRPKQRNFYGGHGTGG